MHNNEFKTKYGPYACVTGASSGIGRAFTFELAQKGLHLILNARNGERLTILKTEIQAMHATCKVVIVAGDVTEEVVQQELVNMFASHDVGLLVASAGFGTSGVLGHTSLETETKMLRVNCEAPLILTHLLIPHLKKRGQGGVILLGSLVGFQGTPYAAHYAATKAYIQTLAEGLYEELRPAGIDVLSVAPGPTHTGFAERAHMNMGKALMPELVARKALMAIGGGSTVQPGWLTKVLRGAVLTVPRAYRVKIMGKVMQGMTEH